MRGKDKGFTLVEILVAVSIVTVLAMLSLFAYNGVNKMSRDAKRQSDLKLIQGALQQYHADQGFYPKNTIPGTVELFSNLASVINTYLSKVPTDPINSGGYTYYYLAKPSASGNCDNVNGNNCVKYSLCARLEGLPAGTYCSGQFNLEVTPP